MLIIVATDTLDRVHGFLRSCMINPHPGVYVSVILDAGSRARIWKILTEWWESEPRGTILMMYRDKKKPMGLAFFSLGAPRRTLVEMEGIYMLLKNPKRSDNEEMEEGDESTN